MICNNCKSEIDDSTKYCPKCGADLSTQSAEYQPFGEAGAPQYQPTYADPGEEALVHDMFKAECSSRLFLALCVLASVSPVVTLISMGLSGVISAVIPAFLAVSCWMMYLAATQNKPITDMINPLKIISVVTAVEWVVNWVAVGIVGVAALICFAGAGVFEEGMHMVMEGLDDAFGGLLMGEAFEGMFVILGIIMLAVAGFLVVLNIFYYGNLRKCTASFRDSAMYGRLAVQKVGTVKSWLMVMGVLSAISAVSSFTESVLGGLGSACGAATLIVAGKILDNIKKATNCD